MRDKLLERPTHDIDIVVEGIPVVELLQRLARGFATVAADPAHGKHVPSYTLHLCGLSVDLVQLRGTPEEDARNRDLTINALFYNVTAKCVEVPIIVVASSI